MAAQNFKNSDLEQIYDALQGGNLPDYLYQILNALMPTNNLVSIKVFTADNAYTGDPGNPGVFELYDAWITANPDWIILNETLLTSNTDGTQYLLIRYRGEKLMADDAG